MRNDDSDPLPRPAETVRQSALFGAGFPTPPNRPTGGLLGSGGASPSRDAEIPHRRSPGASPLSRRALFSRIGGGFGSLGLASVLADAGVLAAASGHGEGEVPGNPLAPRPPHFPARAKRVIFLFMNGGPSHVDTFDPKPASLAVPARTRQQAF